LTRRARLCDYGWLAKGERPTLAAMGARKRHIIGVFSSSSAHGKVTWAEQRSVPSGGCAAFTHCQRNNWVFHVLGGAERQVGMPTHTLFTGLASAFVGVGLPCSQGENTRSSPPPAVRSQPRPLCVLVGAISWSIRDRLFAPARPHSPGIPMILSPCAIVLPAEPCCSWLSATVWRMGGDGSGDRSRLWEINLAEF